jgi:hypothetical protein
MTPAMTNFLPFHRKRGTRLLGAQKYTAENLEAADEGGAALPMADTPDRFAEP